MKIRTEESIDGDTVTAAIYVGEGQGDLAGGLVVHVTDWLTLLDMLGPRNVDRGTCGDCKHEQHLGDVCLSALDDDESEQCWCGFHGDQPAQVVTQPDGIDVAEEIRRDRNFEDRDDA